MKKARSEILPNIKKMASSNQDFFISSVNKLELTDEEAVFLAGKQAKKILSTHRKKRENNMKVSEKTIVKKDESEKKKQKKETTDGFKQQSLGSF
jgi:predicted metal-binding transcription factor (methanogenesis marker protein 9)